MCPGYDPATSATIVSDTEQTFIGFPIIEKDSSRAGRQCEATHRLARMDREEAEREGKLLTNGVDAFPCCSSIDAMFRASLLHRIGCNC